MENLARSSSWYANGAAFLLGCITFVMLVRFVFQQWVLDAAREWRRECDAAEFAANSKIPPVPVSPVPKPWFVQLADRWQARGQHGRKIVR